MGTRLGHIGGKESELLHNRWRSRRIRAAVFIYLVVGCEAGQARLVHQGTAAVIEVATIIEWILLGCAAIVVMIVLAGGAQIVKALWSGELKAVDLVRGKNGKISDEKIWTHIGKAVLVFVMIKDASDGTPDVTLQAVSFLCLAAHEVFIRWMANKENPLGGVFGERRKQAVSQTVTDTTSSIVAKSTTTAPIPTQ